MSSRKFSTHGSRGVRGLRGRARRVPVDGRTAGRDLLPDDGASSARTTPVCAASADVLAERIAGAELVVIAGRGAQPAGGSAARRGSTPCQRHLAACRSVDDADRPRPLGPTHRGRQRISTVRRSYVDDVAVDARRDVGGVRPVDVGARRARSRSTSPPRAPAPGVVGVFTAADLDLPPQRAMAGDGALDRPLLARDRVRFVGEPVAVVVADDTCPGGRRRRARRRRAPTARRWSTDAVAATRARCAAAVPRVRANETTGRHAAPTRGAGWADAEVVVRARFVNHRIAPVPMEPNGCVVVPDGADPTRVVGVGEHAVGVRRATRDRGRARSRRGAGRRCGRPAVGGGFGAKGGVYVEQLVVAALAQRLGRADRVGRDPAREPAQHDARSRSGARRRDRCARATARSSGSRVRGVADVGAYPIRGAFIPMVTRFMASGTYRIPEIEFDARIALTNTTPTGPVPRRGPARSRRARSNARSTCSRACSTSTRSTCGAATSSRPTRSRTAHRRARCTTPATTTARSTRRCTSATTTTGGREQVARRDRGRSPATRHRHRLLRRGERPRRRVRLGPHRAPTAPRPS